MNMLQLKWEEVEDNEGGGYKAETIIGEYIVFKGPQDIWVAELWGGPDTQSVGIGYGETPDAAKQSCVKNYNSIYRQMTADAKERPDPGAAPKRPDNDITVA